jgi:hypothetical protein
MRVSLLMILSVVALGVPAPVLAAQDARADARRAQVAAANADAIEALRRDVLSAVVMPDMTVEQFVQRTDSRDVLDKAVRRAEQIGGTRWVDDQTCQLRLQLPGGEVADALVQAAEAKPRATGIPIEVIRQRVDKLRERTFAATGMSTGAIDRLRPSPDQVAWRGVADAAVQASLNDARRNAAKQMLGRVESVATSSGESSVRKVLADPKVRGELEGWLMSRPVTAADFRDDLEVRISIAPDPDAFWSELATAAGGRKDLGFPADADARDRLRVNVIREVEPTVGRARAKGPAGVAVRQIAAAAGGNNAPMAADIPRDPPRWVTEQRDGKGSSPRVAGGALKARLAAENAARDDLRKNLDDLQLRDKFTLGEAAKRDPRVLAALDHAVKNARARKVKYLSDGGAEVTFTLDLRELWYELDAR